MADLLLLVTLGGRRIAIHAADVEAVVELDGITPAPRTPDHVAGLAALRSRVLTVIDAAASLEIGRSIREGLHEAIVVPSGGHPYALIVDAVDDVVDGSTPLPIGAPIGAGWERVAIGMVDVEGELLLLVDPHLIIAGPTALAA
jgi:purine-binding chemotaxis protein CheW